MSALPVCWLTALALACTLRTRRIQLCDSTHMHLLNLVRIFPCVSCGTQLLQQHASSTTSTVLVIVASISSGAEHALKNQ